MRIQAMTLAVLLATAPLGARAADLVIWWEEGFYPQEDEAVRETITAFEQGSGDQVELVLFEQTELSEKLKAALQAGRPPDFAFGQRISAYITEWAFEDRLVDLTDTVRVFSDLFDQDALAWYTLLNQKTGQRALYALPMGRTSNHVHVWKSLLEQAGFALEDIPKEWEAFWSFWCDQVQPAMRRVTGRDDIWGVGLSMSEAGDTQFEFFRFMAAYKANYVTSDGRLVIDGPEVRRKLAKAIDSFTMIYRKGCTPPASVAWRTIDNNKQFHAQAVVMTANESLSIPNALKHERPEDYYENSETIEWPLGPNSEAFALMGTFFAGAVFKDGGHFDRAKEFVHFLVSEGWLAHYLDFAGERFLPPMPKLLEQPFWLDPNDPHRMAAVMQIASRPIQYEYITVSGDWRYDLVWQEKVWGKAIHRIVTDGISFAQAVDEAIARIKQILSE